jgi:hypothetical protein
MVRHVVARLLLVGQLSMMWQACTSVRTTGSREAPAGTGGIAVRVFADDAARRAGEPSPPAVVGELERRQGGVWRPIFRSLSPSWAVAGLPPGSYRIRFPARLDEGGNVIRLSGSARQVEVREGRVTQVEAVLRHVPAAVVVLAAVTVVVAAVLLAQWLDDHHLPAPPLPPPEVVEAVFYLSLDWPAVGWVGVADRASPVVTSHFPGEGALVAARRVRVVFAFSEPLQPGELEAAGVTVLGEQSGLVPGVVSYDEEQWWVVWEPREDLAPGDTYHVTLAADAVEDLGGNELDAPVSFSFRSAP